MYTLVHTVTLVLIEIAHFTHAKIYVFGGTHFFFTLHETFHSDVNKMAIVAP